MNKIALNLPGFGDIANTPGNKFSETGAGSYGAGSTKIGFLITQFSSLALYVGGALLFILLVWGAFQYIIAEGNKEGLAKARARIRWALIGYVILLLSFFMADFLQTFLPSKILHVTPITSPGEIQKVPVGADNCEDDSYICPGGKMYCVGGFGDDGHGCQNP